MGSPSPTLTMVGREEPGWFFLEILQCDYEAITTHLSGVRQPFLHMVIRIV